MTKIKSIAILCNYELLPERVGGMDYFFWMFDKKCKANGIAVDWFFPNTSLHGEYSQLTIYDSNYGSLENYFLEFYKVNEYTHIISHFLELCTSFHYKIKQQSNAKVIAIDHNPRPLGGYPIKKRIEKRVKGILFSRFIDVFVGVSHYTVNQVSRDFGGQLQHKIKTIHNGVVIEGILERGKRSKTKPSFLVASHLRESKGIQDLIVAVSLLPEEIKKEIKIAVYGDGPYKSTLDSSIKLYHLQKCFTFMGSSPNLKTLFSNYDYMLQPTHMECFSLSILESLAANVPVITTNVGGNEEVIVNGENGYIFEAKDTHALKEIIQSIYLGHKRIDINTRLVIENNFSLIKMVEQHLALVLDNKS
jgi:L-malate glycosyltransferase